MGLDTTHDCWHGAYSAFNRWRNEVARAAGYMLRQVLWDAVEVNRPMPYVREYILLDWGRVSERHNLGLWDTKQEWDRKMLEYDPLIILLVHSDCDGEIGPIEAALLADRLEKLLPALPDADGGGHVGNYRTTTQKFINGLRLAASQNEAVLFQ